MGGRADRAAASGDVAAFAVEGEDGDDDVVVLVQCRLQRSEQRSKRCATKCQRSSIAAPASSARW